MYAQLFKDAEVFKNGLVSIKLPHFLVETHF